MPVFRRRGRIRLQSRLLVAFVSLVAVTIALVILVMDYQQQRFAEDLYRQKGMAIAHSLAAASSSALLSYNYVALQQLTQRAVEEEGVSYVIILDKEGVIAGYSGQPEMQGERLNGSVSNAASRSEWTLVQKVAPGEASPYPGLDISVPVYVEGSPQKWGTVRVGLSLEKQQLARNRTRMWGLGIGFGVLGPAVIVALLLARHITGPVKRLVAGTRELARGNFDYRVGVTTGDEFEDLSHQFESMAQEIREKHRELAALNANLEDQVGDRTRELLEAEQKYRILVEQSPNPICIIQDARLRFVNRAFCQTFGHADEDLLDPSFDIQTLLDPVDRASTMTFWTRLTEGTASDTPREVVAQHKDGTRIHLDIRSTLISYQGAPAVEAILVDITEQRQLRDRVVAYERLRALGEMAGGVAHDFNNVLGAILGRAQLLQDFECEDRVRQGLKIIEKAAQDGAETVKRIQEFTRVRTDRNFDRVDLSEVLEDVLEMTRSRWEDDAHRQGKRIEMVRDLATVPDVSGHISELREAFTNLILNAVDAISSEGTVTIRCRGEGDQVVVSVIDTGKGMPPEVQRRMFDPFFTTKGSNGTGLGMSIVYGIIRRHDAAIEVRSKLHEGTEFRIEFPAAQGREKAALSDPETEEIRSGSGRILVADDEPEIRSLVRDILIEAGYEVETVPDGTRALELLRSTCFDMLITDLGMPDITGWEVAHEARTAQPGIGLILITGWAAAVDPQEVERHRIDQILRKPFEMAELLSGVSEVLGARSLRKSA